VCLFQKITSNLHIFSSDTIIYLLKNKYDIGLMKPVGPSQLMPVGLYNLYILALAKQAMVSRL